MSVRGFLFLLNLALLCGCEGAPASNYDGLGLVPVSGKITLDGQPLPNAVVTFDAPDGQFAYGLTDANGQYSLQVDSVAKGCPPGPRVVRVSTARKILGLNSSEEGGQEGGEGPPKPKAEERVPAKYNKDSDQKVEVSKGTTSYDFDLKS
jgi:hypothetical protein